MTTHISDGNTKLGSVPNISLRPVLDCSNCKLCAGSCYARKAFRMYPAVRKNWTENARMAREQRLEYFASVDNYVTRRAPRFFRWHVSGDILDQDYIDRMGEVARMHPETRFLAFTKMHALDYARRPRNLEVVFSRWPGDGEVSVPKGIRCAWMQDGTETRVPRAALRCPGNCESCGMCWTLGKLRMDVTFDAH